MHSLGVPHSRSSLNNSHYKRPSSQQGFHKQEIFLAAQSGQTDILAQLISFGVDINTTNNVGSTPLHVAAIRGHDLVVYFLIRSGANVDATDSKHKTALHYAYQLGHESVVRRLMHAGADVGITDLSGHTPFQIVPRSCDPDVQHHLGSDSVRRKSPLKTLHKILKNLAFAPLPPPPPPIVAVSDPPPPTMASGPLPNTASTNARDMAIRREATQLDPISTRSRNSAITRDASTDFASPHPSITRTSTPPPLPTKDEDDANPTNAPEKRAMFRPSKSMNEMKRFRQGNLPPHLSQSTMKTVTDSGWRSVDGSLEHTVSVNRFSANCSSLRPHTQQAPKTIIISPGAWLDDRIFDAILDAMPLVPILSARHMMTVSHIRGGPTVNGALLSTTPSSPSDNAVPSLLLKRLLVFSNAVRELTFMQAIASLTEDPTTTTVETSAHSLSVLLNAVPRLHGVVQLGSYLWIATDDLLVNSKIQMPASVLELRVGCSHDGSSGGMFSATETATTSPSVPPSSTWSASSPVGSATPSEPATLDDLFFGVRGMVVQAQMPLTQPPLVLGPDYTSALTADDVHVAFVRFFTPANGTRNNNIVRKVVAKLREIADAGRVLEGLFDLGVVSLVVMYDSTGQVWIRMFDFGEARITKGPSSSSLNLRKERLSGDTARTSNSGGVPEWVLGMENLIKLLETKVCGP